MSEDINKLLSRSAELEALLVEFLNFGLYANADRAESSRIMCSVAFEHSESAKMLIASGNFTSATGLVRIQYEAMVRAYWLLYGASDLMISKLMTELTEDSARKANKLPMLSEMLKRIKGKAPPEAIELITEFKEYSWKPLSSYVHGGIHAINRHSKGYPVSLLVQALRASNGVSLMVGMLLVILSGDKSHQGKIGRIQMDYIDCIPVLRPGNSQ